MIVDNLLNYKFYSFLHNDIFVGLEYLSQINSNIDLGVYEIKDNVRAIISEYETMESFKFGYEAHRRVIDIQYPLIGRERVLWGFKDNLTLTHGHDPIKDVEYYAKTSNDINRVDIGNGVFAIMFPSDAHGPQQYIDRPQLIKKATIKIKI